MNIQTPPQSFPRIYLVRRSAYSAGIWARANSYLRRRSKKLTAASIAGIAAGWIAATIAGTAAPRPTNSPFPSEHVAARLPNSAVTQPAVQNITDVHLMDKSSHELERLRARNRRLEALVSVLRSREAHQQDAVPGINDTQTIVIVK